MIKAQRNNCLLLLCLLLYISTQAQFKNTATLQPVNKTGFYSIAVTPVLSSYVKTDFSDLRIKDDEGKPVPYVVRETVWKHYDTVVAKLKILKNELADSGKSVVIIENTAVRQLNTIALLINNNTVSRRVDVSGSDDEKQWYTITENGSIGKGFISDKDKYLEVLSIPSSSYKYFKFTIYNNGKDPLNILSVGDYVNWQFKYVNPYLFNPKSDFKQVDSSDGHSYIYVHDSARFHKDFLNIKFASPRFFKRDCEVWADGHRLCAFTVSADTLFSTLTLLFNAQDWMVKVYNGDNPPLPVRDIYTFKTEENIITWLDSGKSYHLEMNDSLAAAPVYDLQDFKDSIPAKVADIKVGAVEPITVTAVKASSSFFKQQWLWVVLGTVLLLLVVFTARLTRDMGKQQ